MIGRLVSASSCLAVSSRRVGGWVVEDGVENWHIMAPCREDLQVAIASLENGVRLCRALGETPQWKRREQGLRLAYVLETHAHADPRSWLIENPGFVSGGSSGTGGGGAFGATMSFPRVWAPGWANPSWIGPCSAT